MMEFDKAMKNDVFSAVNDYYEETGANILKAYTHNKEAMRLHERGFYKAAKHHAEHVLGLSLKATEQIGKAIAMAKAIEVSPSV